VNNKNSESHVLNHIDGDTVKKNNQAPTLKVYGNVNDLVQALSGRGHDGSLSDDNCTVQAGRTCG
jgi:hypothetical protein